jgi:hypothetical protein
MVSLKYITFWLLTALFPITAEATSYFVASTGNNANAGTSAGSAWLTMAYAVAHVACGDTINVVANNLLSAGDFDFPYFAGCVQTTTIQSSALVNFQPIGYRTNPTTDAANYGRLQLTTTGIRATTEVHGSNLNGGNGFLCWVSALASDTFTLWCGGAGLPAFSNGTQIEFETRNEGNPLATGPTGFSLFTKYYVVNCSGCSANGSTFKIAATSGGAALTGLSCTGTCTMGAGSGSLGFTVPLQVTAGSANIVMGDSPTIWATDTPIAFSAAGFQDFGTLPTPLVKDTVYYIISVSGSTIQVSATQGGSAITITDIGSGPLIASNTNVASQWALRGLEIVDGVGSYLGGAAMLQLGSSGAASNVVGVVHHMEVDRCYIRSQNNGSEGKGIEEEGAYANIHDNYIAGFSSGESQAIFGAGSPGPTLITNNFLEAAGEVILYGGNYNGSGTANANKIITGNYGYKPPTWKFSSGTVAASGPCWYDATDPLLTGGEWYTNTMSGQKYRCNSSGVWSTTALTYPGYGSPTVKAGFEHKNGQNFLYSGNVMNYNWAAAQQGQWFNNSEEYGSGPGMANDHITIQNNAIYNVFVFRNRITVCGLTLVLPCINNSHDHTTINNLVVTTPLACGVSFIAVCGVNPFQDTTLGGDGTNPTVLAIPFQTDVNKHNTIYTPDSGWVATLRPIFATSPSGGCVFSPTMNLETYINNIVPGNLLGDCGWTNEVMVSQYFSNSTFSNNAMVGGSVVGGSPGATNTWTNTVYPTNNAAVDYVNATGTIGGDYHLASGSNYSASNGSATRLSTDGTDLGADIDAIRAATSGSIAGTPPWTTRMNFSIAVGPTGAIATYDRPGSGACSLTIYNAPARISANENADTNSSGNKLDTRTGNTVVGSHVTFVIGNVAPLTIFTQYWYSLSCVAADTSTWLLAGDSFTTRPTVIPSRTSIGKTSRLGKTN